AAATAPPDRPATRACGFGIRLTRNSVDPNDCVCSPIRADTWILALPGWVTRATYFPPEPETVTPCPLTLRLSLGMPGADTEMGLSTPMYSTFIASGDTTAEGRAT